MALTHTIFSQSWKVEVWDQGVSRAALPLKAPEKDLFQVFLLVLGSSLASNNITSVFTWHSLCVCAYGQISPFNKKPVIPN